MLINSFQDHYVTYESARIEQCEPSQLATEYILLLSIRKGQVYMKMVDSLSEKMNTADLYRIDIGFNISKKNMDNFIGRTAHILFLQDEVLMKIFAYYYSKFFK